MAQGWLGGDGDTSVQISSGRSLWFFDDTFIGKPDQTSRPGSTMIHNTIGISSGNPLNGPWNVSYFWNGQGTSSPAAVFSTPSARASGQWFWPSDAALVGGRVYVALEASYSTPGQNLGFGSAGVTLATIENPMDAPASWNIRYAVLTTEASCFPGAAMALDAAGENLLLYMTCNNANPSAWQRPVSLLRIPVTGLAAPIANLQYLATDGTWQPGMPPAMSAATTVMPAGHTEFTVRFHPELGLWIAIMILPGPYFTNQLSMFTAPAPQGPWTTPAGVYTYPEMTAGSPLYVDSSTFCYAAKEHVELETPGSGKLVVSYACNDSLGVVAEHMTLYVPRLIEINAP